MQLQLSMAVADRLHETLLVRGEPLDVAEAACLLVASPSCPPPVAHRLVETLAANDSRFRLADGATLATRVELSTWAGWDPHIADVPFVALDLETTGSRPGIGKITEVGAVRLECFREVKRFNTLIDPRRPIPPMISRITGITRSMTMGAPRIEEVIPELLEFLDGAVVVAHNASFDVDFLNYELRRLMGRQLGEGAIDTLPLARALAPGLPNYRLGTVAEALGAPVTVRHRALADAEAAGHIFVTLAQRLIEEGTTRLSQLRSYSTPQNRSAVEKLSLTRGAPESPGTYRFLDGEGRVLYVGMANELRSEVRSHFVTGAKPKRKIRQAIRRTEHIDWTETHTPLEALVRQHELINRHQPPGNVYGGRPDNYVYLRLTESRLGRHLGLTTRGPEGDDRRRPLAAAPLEKAGAERRRQSRRGCNTTLLGPFRGRARTTTALDLLRISFPIRCCPRGLDGRPCVRGTTGHCLAPCGDDPGAKQEHDALVHGLLDWIAGRENGDGIDPRKRVHTLVRDLRRRHHDEEAQEIQEAWDDLQSLRRSYGALAEARGLCYAMLWPRQDHRGAPTLRLNLVWQGSLRHSASLTEDSAEELLSRAFDPLLGEPPGCGAEASPNGFIAVPQNALDALLAVRRWTLDFLPTGDVPLIRYGEGRDDEEPTMIEAWRDRVAREAVEMLRA